MFSEEQSRYGRIVTKLEEKWGRLLNLMMGDVRLGNGLVYMRASHSSFLWCAKFPSLVCQTTPTLCSLNISLPTSS